MSESTAKNEKIEWMGGGWRSNTKHAFIVGEKGVRGVRFSLCNRVDDRYAAGALPTDNPCKRCAVLAMDVGQTCNARPLGGDGSSPCTLRRNHKGLHEGSAGAFRAVDPGSSPRSPHRVKKRVLAEYLTRGAK